MKILYFIDHLRPDGTQVVLCQLVEGLARRGHSQSVICLNDSWDGTLVERLRRAGADVRIVGKLALASGYGLFSIWRSLCRTRYDVAVTLLFYSDVVGRTLARVAKVPRIVTTLQARNIHYTSLQRWLVRKTIRWVNAVAINSTYSRDFAMSVEGARSDLIHFIPNSVRVEDYNAPLEQAPLRAELGLPQNGWLLGTVGRLTYQKGIDVLLHALSLLPSANVYLLLIGKGDQDKCLRGLAHKLGLENRVCFLGFRRDVPRLLGTLDLYIQPSRFEGMPLALLEAMAAACPIVASSVDGNRDLVESGTQGWLVPSEDPVALAEAIQEALSDLDEARRRGAAARQRVMDHYSVEAMVLDWENILTK